MITIDLDVEVRPKWFEYNHINFQGKRFYTCKNKSLLVLPHSCGTRTSIVSCQRKLRNPKGEVATIGGFYPKAMDKIFGESDKYLGRLEERGFDKMFLHTSCWKDKYLPTDTGKRLEYFWKDESIARDLIGLLHSRGWKVCPYINGFYLKEQESIETVKWQVEFANTWGIDGWYIDRPKISNDWYEIYSWFRVLYGTYDYIIISHMSEDPIGEYSGVVGTFLHNLSDYIYIGESIAKNVPMTEFKKDWWDHYRSWGTAKTLLISKTLNNKLEALKAAKKDGGSFIVNVTDEEDLEYWDTVNDYNG